LIAFVAALTLAATASPVLGDEFGTSDGDTGPFADSAIHEYCWGPGFDAALKDNATAAFVNLDAQTDMSDSFLPVCNVTTTDVWWFDADLPGTVRGQYKCVTWVVFDSICNSSDITLDPAQINIGDFDQLDTTKSACHEVGHSVGLTHITGGDDCMMNGQIPNENAQYQRYNAHHVGHINGRY